MRIIPTVGRCMACYVQLDDDDGYLVTDETGQYRFCDDHGIEDLDEPFEAAT